MEADIAFADKVKLAFRYSSFKLNQLQLTTKEKCVLETSHGPIKGIKRITLYGKHYYSFEGIPFAKPPVGELRFKSPQPPEPWTKVRNCTEPGPKPVQINIILNKPEGSEDCLYLNVYSKEVKPAKPLPVMVWIYGGAFQVGESSRDLYSPDYLMESDVVVVSITYRLGPFGFLSLDDNELGIPGNAGLKDQVFALKWVKENCRQFGGDPDNITVFGESAGAASTHFLMLTDKTEGLFHKGILQSGTAMAPWAVVPQRNWTYRLARKLGYQGNFNDRSVLNYLLASKSNDIVKGADKLLTAEERESRFVFAFGPTVEPYNSDDCVIPKPPMEMMRETWSNRIPMLIGTNSFEGLLLNNETKKQPQLLNELGNCENIVPWDLKLDKYSEKCKEYGIILKKTHFGDKEPGRDTKTEYFDLVSYKYWYHPLRRTCKSRTTNASAPTYLYRFDFDSKHFNHFRVLSCGKKMRGVCHADDLSYLFYNALAKKLKPSTKEYKTIQRMVAIWTKFASDSDPNCKMIGDVSWKHLEEGDEELTCLNISDEVAFIKTPEAEKLKVWDSLYEEGTLW